MFSFDSPSLGLSYTRKIHSASRGGYFPTKFSTGSFSRAGLSDVNQEGGHSLSGIVICSLSFRQRGNETSLHSFASVIIANE